VTFQGCPLGDRLPITGQRKQVARWLVGGCLHGKLVQGFPMLDQRSRTYLGQRPELLAAYRELLPKRTRPSPCPRYRSRLAFTMTHSALLPDHSSPALLAARACPELVEGACPERSKGQGCGLSPREM